MSRAAMLLKQGIVMTPKKGVGHGCYIEYQDALGNNKRQSAANIAELKLMIASVGKTNLYGDVYLFSDSVAAKDSNFQAYLSDATNIVNLTINVDLSLNNVESVAMGNLCRRAASLVTITMINVQFDKIASLGYAFNGAVKLKQCTINGGGIFFASAPYMFSDATELEYIDLSTANIVDGSPHMSSAFQNCEKVKTAYARTQADATYLNSTSNKPTNWQFVPKP